MTSTPQPRGPVLTPEQSTWFSQLFNRLAENIEQVVLGKDHVVRLALATLITGGHLLLEDYPGTGKTSLARAIAQSVDGKAGRIQFTPDLLPGDVTGMSVYDQSKGVFSFHPGPVFSTILLADEINRASPKTQSALLEVMEEGRVTVDGVTHRVPDPFMVIATQNPVEQAGTYRLPEAQLDRFLMKTTLGYPDPSSTKQILRNAHIRSHHVELDPVVDTRTLQEMAALARMPYVDDALLDYATRLVEATRQAPEVRLGVSVRGALALVRAATTWSVVQGRNYVIPDDLKTLADPVLAHRLVLDPEAEFDGVSAASVIGRILLDVAPPTERTAA
ncbi:MAG: MoxR family ATPase [Arthrobacter sp.]|nr:MoxR family ATPase [Arthrobacter sp.]